MHVKRKKIDTQKDSAQGPSWGRIFLGHFGTILSPFFDRFWCHSRALVGPFAASFAPVPRFYAKRFETYVVSKQSKNDHDMGWKHAFWHSQKNTPISPRSLLEKSIPFWTSFRQNHWQKNDLATTKPPTCGFSNHDQYGHFLVENSPCNRSLY